MEVSERRAWDVSGTEMVAALAMTLTLKQTVSLPLSFPLCHTCRQNKPAGAGSCFLRRTVRTWAGGHEGL